LHSLYLIRVSSAKFSLQACIDLCPSSESGCGASGLEGWMMQPVPFISGTLQLPCTEFVRNLLVRPGEESTDGIFLWIAGTTAPGYSAMITWKCMLLERQVSASSFSKDTEDKRPREESAAWRSHGLSHAIGSLSLCCEALFCKR
jgi:hypothetical protein